MLLLFSISNLVYGESVKLAYVNFPPYEYQQNGKPKGILVEIVQKLFKRVNVNLELEYLPFKRAFEESKTGRIDGIFNFYKHKDRLKHFDYTDSLISNKLCFFVNKNSTFEYNRLEDLSGLHIGVIRGYTYGRDFDTSDFFVKEACNSHIGNFQKLNSNRIDAYPCDKLVGLHTALSMNLMKKFTILPEPLMIMKGYIGFSKGKNKEIIGKLNKEIMIMKRNGEIDTIIDYYIKKNNLNKYLHITSKSLDNLNKKEKVL